MIPISNTLLQDEQGGLLEYIGKWFAKKDVRTVNTAVFTALKAGKSNSAEALAAWKELKTSFTIDLDPMVSANAVMPTSMQNSTYP